jgi:type IV/VI secretion system ImpK/VasF family protein
MHEAIARYVHAVFHRGLELALRSAAGGPIEVDAEQAELEGLLFHEPPDELARELVAIDRFIDPAMARVGTKPTPAIEKIRYLLICWLDDLFILSSSLADEWSESKLEVRLTGQNDRSAKFWVHVHEAERRHQINVLEVAYVCVALGFRGEMADDPEQLAGWLERTRSKIASNQPQPIPAALSWKSVAHPLDGLERFRRMAFLAAVVALASIPIVTLVLTSRLGR